jgi:hypothetical protein
VTPLKSQTDFTSPFSSSKWRIEQKYFNGKYNNSTVLLQKKVGGCLDLIYGFSGVNDTSEALFGDFRSNYLDAICKMVLAC